MVSPVVSATIQATVLSATSNILAQVLQTYRDNTPFILDPSPLLKFIIFTILNTPPNFLWGSFLEDTFPAFTVKPTIVKSKVAVNTAASTEKKPGATVTKEELVPEKSLNIRNTAIKFTLDQTVGALFNTVAFIAGMAALNGAGSDEIWAKVTKNSFPLMFAGYKLWPVVSLLNFTVVPFEWRVIFGGLVGVGWGIFLSLFTSG